MKKIISLFQRNYGGDHLVRNEVAPGAEWVLAGHGVATRKFDGTCCLFRDGRLYKRYEVKRGNVEPFHFVPATDVDSRTGKQQGWVPVGDGPEDEWHREAIKGGIDWSLELFESGATYELLGPKVQGNPENCPTHVLIRHGCVECRPEPPRDFDGLREYLIASDIEGVVWHHPDGRMVKIKKSDFGFKR